MGFREKKGFFGRLSERIGDVIMGRAAIDEELFDELEEVLITSDIGMQTTLSIIDTLRDRVKNEYITEPEKVKEKLKEIMIQAVDKGDRQKMSETYPLVIMMIGINGGGKTTTIGKLAAMYKKQGKSVLLAAADTFRAAAAEQLTIWADRVGVGIIKHGEGADPSAVLFDAAQAAKARGVDVLICDTAGRLQNKKNLMEEPADGVGPIRKVGKHDAALQRAGSAIQRNMAPGKAGAPERGTAREPEDILRDVVPDRTVPGGESC